MGSRMVIWVVRKVGTHGPLIGCCILLSIITVLLGAERIFVFFIYLPNKHKFPFFPQMFHLHIVVHRMYARSHYSVCGHRKVKRPNKYIRMFYILLKVILFQCKGQSTTFIL